MFNIYIKDFNRNGSLVETEELVQTIPANEQGELKLLSPIVKNDMGNAESFSFNIESGTPYYDAFLQMKTFVRVEYDGTTIFYGRVLTIDNGFYGTRKIRLEGPLTFFNDSPVEGVKESSRSTINVKEYLENLIQNHNKWINDSKRSFVLGEVPGYYSSASAEQQVITNADVTNKKRKFGSDSWTDTKSALEDLRSHYGGYFRVRSVPFVDTIGQYGRGNIDLNNRIVVHNSDGTISTEKSFSISRNGKEVLIPLIVNGVVLSEANAIQHYENTGEYLGKFNSVAAADAYAEKLHIRQEWYYTGQKPICYNYLDWMNHYFNSEYNTQTIELGKNILDINSVTEVDNIFTVLIPIGNNKVTKTEDSTSGKKSNVSAHFYVSGKEITVPSVCQKYTRAQLNSGYHKYEDYAQAINKYGRIIKTVAFDDAKNKTELTEKAYEWIKNNYQGEVTKFTVKAIDMHQIGENTQKIMVGDRVKLIYPIGSENGVVTKSDTYQTCLSIQYDLYNPENNQYTFGIPANILTKTYGLTKQGKSVNNGNKARPKDNSKKGDEEQDWLDVVYSWLESHMIRYKSNGGPVPYTTAFDRYMTGPYSGIGWRKNYFVTHSDLVGGEFLIWRVRRTDVVWDIEADPQFPSVQALEKQYNDIARFSSTAARDFKNAHSKNVWSWNQNEPTAFSAFTTTTLYQSNLIEYIKDEYGIDVRTGLAVKIPKSVTLDDGSKYTYDFGTDSETGDPKIVTKEFLDGETGTTVFYNEKGQKITSWRDSNGTVHYYIDDPASPGGVKEVNDRDLAFDTVKTANEHGQLVQAYFRKPIYEKNPDGTIKRDRYGRPIQKLGPPTEEYPDGEPLYEKNEKGEYVMEPYGYMFSQAIEYYEGGSLVVTKVDGDKVVLGSTHTQQQTRLALENITDVCGEFYVETDPVTGLDKVVVIEGTGVVQNTRDPDGNVYQAGYFHEGNLTGGILVQKLNGETITTINGTRVKVGNNNTLEVGVTATQLATFGVIDPVTKKLTGGIVSEALDDGTVTTKIKGDIITLGPDLDNEDLSTWAVDAKDGTGVFAKYLTVKQLTAEEINTMFANASFATLNIVSTNSLTSNYSTLAGQIWIGVGAKIGYMGDNTQHALSNLIVSASVNTSTNTLTLTPLNGSPITFSKAASDLSGAWSGSHYVVSAGNQSYSIGFDLPDPDPRDTGIIKLSVVVNSDQSITLKSGTTKTLLVPVKVDQDFRNDPGTSRYTKTLEVDATPAYNAGSMSVELKDPVWDINGDTVDGNYSNNSYTYQNRAVVTTKGRSVTASKAVGIKLSIASDWNAYHYKQIKVVNSATNETICAAPVSAASLYSDAKQEGINSVTAVPATFPEFASGQPGQTRDTVTVISKTSTGVKDETTKAKMVLSTYIIGGTGTKHNCVDLKNGNVIVGRVSIQSVYQDGVNSVTVAPATIPSFNSNNAGATRTTITVTSNTNTGLTNSDTKVKLSRSTYTIDSAGTKNYCVNLSEVTDDGDVIRGRISTQATYKKGWTDAYENVAFPSSQPSSYNQYITVSTPVSVPPTGGASGQNSIKYYVTSENDGYTYIRYNNTNGAKLARVKNTLSVTANDATIQNWRFSNTLPTGITDYTDLNEISGLLRNNSHGYVYFSVKVTGLTGTKWYRITTPQ